MFMSLKISISNYKEKGERERRESGNSLGVSKANTESCKPMLKYTAIMTVIGNKYRAVGVGL